MSYIGTGNTVNEANQAGNFQFYLLTTTKQSKLRYQICTGSQLKLKRTDLTQACRTQTLWIQTFWLGILQFLWKYMLCTQSASC